ncbi:hypothetical protein PHYPSEUDO_001007 [Phytophthora pseudosyringae]|uniref:Transmembrane protein n=1 Tax=Phytophthora pseudosyringae TaxID=221518 RepID=A0A8T1VY33_9STRA|nr:hypothetical protein PHYPSEUDO_001007 [Phytophthora pseudosyringae]
MARTYCGCLAPGRLQFTRRQYGSVLNLRWDALVPPPASSAPLRIAVVMPLANADIDAPKRLSFLSGSQTKDIEDGYVGVKTPELGDGALREGGMPVLTSKDNIGLLFQYAVVGLVYGLLPETIYPFMQNYLNCSGAQVASAQQLVVLPWSFKVFYGILSDCRPIFGYRRRPYMLIGWGVCFIMLLVMCIMPIGKPYFLVSADRDITVADYTPEIEARINHSAPDEGAKYVMIMFFAAVGYVLSDVCADSITCELAQREPIDKRGKTQSCIYTVRTAMVIFGEILVGFFFNGEEYGGDFDFSLSFPQLMIIVTVLTLPVFPMTWFFIHEEKAPATNFRAYISDFWNLLCSRAMYQIVAYLFFAGIFANITYTGSTPVASYMVGVTPINSTLSDILSNLLFAAGIMITSKWGLHWNWRWMIPFATSLTLAIDGPFNVTNERVQADTHSVRTDITWTIIIMYAMTIFSWVFLFLLPPQKAETQALVRKGGHSKLIGGLTAFYLIFAIIWSIMTNIMAMFDSTSCLIIAGGTGC